MENIISWLQLSFLFGGSVAGGKLLRKYRTAEAILSLDPTLLTHAGEITGATADKLRRAPGLRARAQSVAAVCRNFGWQVLTPESKFYPQEFLFIKDPPYVVYAYGDLTCLTQRQKASVVGTRKPADKAMVAAYDLAAVLSQNGIVTVSGGALGIDSAAHEGALLAGGPTVCVMGCGLGTDYLRENEALRREIRANGALVTEYPPFTPASRYTFPTRNRLISGMSLGVLVVEAGERSGSLITAHRANEQGREVFAIPGSVLTTAYKGANSLIRDGAKAVTCARDVLAAFAMMYPDRLDLTKTGPLATEPPAAPQTQPAAQTPAQPAVSEAPAAEKTKKVPAAPLDPDAARVYNLFGGTPLHPDEIAAATGLSPAQLIPVLLQLTLADLIAPTDGGCYTLA